MEREAIYCATKIPNLTDDRAFPCSDSACDAKLEEYRRFAIRSQTWPIYSAWVDDVCVSDAFFTHCQDPNQRLIA